MNHRTSYWCRKCQWKLFSLTVLLCQSALVRGDETTSIVSFAQDIRPILSEHCFYCHGPDANTREADLRLDLQQAFISSGQTAGIVVAGKPDESELLRRISSADNEERMPPADVGERLSAKQIESIRQWIAAGAVWQQHWAFTKPKRPTVPSTGDDHWSRNEIDRFILQRLRQQKLSPSPDADKQTLIRRVSLDLTGLPPSPEDVDRFLSDQHPDAYERLVNRLLASPRYGEQMAVTWLDAARYADTYGYQDDGETSMWRWRDWVIEAYNANMPFDQFTIEQLAGDLLPDATLAQQIATGFNRNHRHNSEGGAIPEEFRVEYVVDRVNTTSTVWLGMTLGCARCHDHKYDPVTQKEFYELFAFFNNVPEDGRARKEGNTPPLMAAPTREQLAQENEIQRELQSALKHQADLESAFLIALEKWQDSLEIATLPNFSDVTHDLDVHYKLDGNLTDEVSLNPDGLFAGGTASFASGAIGQATVLDGKRTIIFSDVGSFSSDDRATITAWIRPTNPDGVILSKIDHPHDPQDEGYSLLLSKGRLRVHFTAQWHDDAIRLQTQTRVPQDSWTHVAVTYDGLHLAQGIQVYFDGKLQPIEVELDSLYQGFSNKGALMLGTAGDTGLQFQGALDDVRIYQEQLTEGELALLSVKESIAQLLKLSPAQRTPHQQHKLRTFFLEHFAANEFRQVAARVAHLQQELLKHRRSYPTVMVMKELAQPRLTYLLGRGQYDAPDIAVSPRIPVVFAGLPDDAPRNRLGLARWLVSPNNPLTARVAVNRLWQMSFDRGLVRTPEDFGSQGEAPSHPQLLDWLASELVAVGWDVKAIRRLIVTSAAYCQQSHTTPELQVADPDNLFLARGPRFRLPAETIRDQALFASGLLAEQLGGPSVKPYQPSGLWKELNDDEYEQDTGEKLYRRSLYTFWKRTITHPLMGAFDAASREVCSVSEGRTNTPLQALALLNEAGLVEAARVLAERAMTEVWPRPQERLTRAFRLATSRTVRPQELDILLASFEQHLAHYSQHIDEAHQLVSQGERPRQEQLDVAELAAYTTIANMLLNLDEVVMQH